MTPLQKLPWHKTACTLCNVNCGIEVQSDGRAITRIRGAKENPVPQVGHGAIAAVAVFGHRLRR